MADADPIDDVATHAVFYQLGKEVGQCVLADLPQPTRRDLEPALPLVDKASVGQLLRQLGQLLQ